MKLIKLTLLSLMVFSFTIPSTLMAYEDRGDLSAVERLEEDMHDNIREKKSIRDRSLLVSIKGKGKLTTIGKYLKTAGKGLTKAQLHLITLPIVTALMQNSPVVEVNMGGANIKEMRFVDTSPVNPNGASFVVVYSGNTTFPEQVFRALQTPAVK